MPALLLLQALAQRLHELVPAHRLDLLLLFLGEVFFGELLQPFGRNVRLLHGVEQALQPLEHGAEHAIELVEIALVLHQRGARQIVEILHRLLGEVGVERLHQRQIFAQGHRDLGVAQRCEELQEHGLQIARRHRRTSRAAEGLDLPGFSTRIEPSGFQRGIHGYYSGTRHRRDRRLARRPDRRGAGFGLIGNIVIGIIGALVAGWLLPQLASSCAARWPISTPPSARSSCSSSSR